MDGTLSNQYHEIVSDKMSNEKIDIHATIQEDEEPTDLQPGMILGIDKFELLEEIGKGYMGIVWKAHDRVGDRLVALKFVQTELGRAEKEMERMRASFGKIHDLRHPTICPIYSLEKDSEYGYYLVMKYLKGETLDDYKCRKDPKANGLPLDHVIELLKPVASALDYAHRNHVIHRDIKPSNIFLAENGGRVEVQVIDFGLADEFQSSLSRVSKPGEIQKYSKAGTPAYMAPEQWMGHPQKATTDQYGLATVAYELLAGHLPFSGNNIQNAVLRFAPEPIDEIPTSANAALQRALAKKGKERFTSCQDFIDTLSGREQATVSPNVTKRTAVEPGVESLMKRGNLFLEDSDWKQATEYFNRVLDIDPEYASAYIGILCAELKIKGEDLLGNYKTSIAEQNNFKKAIRFANDEYRTTLEGYDERIRERLQQEQYDRLVQEKSRVSTEKAYQELASQFLAMDGYKDTATFANECGNQYRIFKERREEQERQEQKRKLQEQYDRLLQAKQKVSTKYNEYEYQRLAEHFQKMSGYKDATKLASECDTQYHALKEQREERERKEAEARAIAVRAEQDHRIRQEQKRAGERKVLAISGVEYPFRYCPLGKFIMGSPASKKEGSYRETQHQVTLTQGFWMLETEVTQAMWEGIMGNNPSHFKGGFFKGNKKLPVEGVSWNDCQEYIKKLNGLGVAPEGYRFSLPTEAQWEYACRAGTTTPFNFGSTLNGDKANCNGNHPYGTTTKGQNLAKTTEVGTYPANAWGLYDMHGNVCEWCSDWSGDYPSCSVTNPVGPSSGSYRVLWGGGWYHYARNCRSAYRSDSGPSFRSYSFGVRLSLVRAE